VLNSYNINLYIILFIKENNQQKNNSMLFSSLRRFLLRLLKFLFKIINFSDYKYKSFKITLIENNFIYF
jgi:hypothetical protein